MPSTCSYSRARPPGVSVRQLLAPPLSILKMDFGTIHRGIANQGDENRVLFWISVKRGADLLPAEPVVQVIGPA